MIPAQEQLLLAQVTKLPLGTGPTFQVHGLFDTEVVKKSLSFYSEQNYESGDTLTSLDSLGLRRIWVIV